MGPTLQSTPLSMESPSSSNKDTPNSPQEPFRGKLRKLKVPIHSAEKQVDEIKYVIAVLSKLTATTTSSNSKLVYHERIAFEGPDAEDNNKTFEIPSNDATLSELSEQSSIIEEQSSNYVRIFVEQYEFQTLQQWLQDRDTCLLHVVQVQQIALQLVTALKLLMEAGINEIRETVSCENIHVVQERDNLLEDYIPNLKFAFLKVEKTLNALTKQEIYQPMDLLKTIASLWVQLLQRCKRMELRENLDLKSEFPEEMCIINDVMECNGQNFSLQFILSLISRIENIGGDSRPVLLNLTQAPARFVGRQSELKDMNKIIDDGQNRIIAVHGDSGSGKTAFISHLSHSLISKEFSILSFNGTSSDSLTVSIRTCAEYGKLKLGIQDYKGGLKTLKNIFHEILNIFKGKKLLVILEDVEYASEEIMELIWEFDDNVDNEKSLFLNHFLILTMEENWPTENDIGKKCSSVHLKELDHRACKVFFQSSDQDQQNDDEEECQNVEQGIKALPAALELIASHMSSSSINDPSSFLQDVRSYRENHAEVVKFYPDIFAVPLLYTMSVQTINDSLQDADKEFFKDVLSLLQNIDGHYGIQIDLINEILCQNQNASSTLTLPQIISALKTRFLIYLRGNMIHLSNWMQDSLKTALKFLVKGQRTNAFKSKILGTMRSILTSSSEMKWKTVPHVMQTWLNLCRKDKGLANRFDDMPELIVDIAKKENRLDCVISFLKQASDIFTTDDSGTYDYRVLKLNFILAKDYLLCQSRMNEAFQVLKIIYEHSLIEPREFLMMKLKSLIELGQIHIQQQDYERAISCFQQVQIFAAQKIATIELDSEPTLLKARMMHGYAHLQEGKLEEGKKNLLHVIPLLERYSGPESEEIRRLLIQGKFYLAVLLRQNGDLVNALMMQKKILKEREKTLGRKHPDTWASKREMALLYSSYDNHERALVILRSLLEVQEEVLGAPSNRQSLATMNAIAEIEAKLGNFDDALELYEAIDLIQQEVLSDTDEMKISSQLNQAEVLMSLGQYKEATDIFDLIYALKSTAENRTSQDMALCESVLKKREKAGRSMEVLGNYWLSLTPENVDDPAELSSLAKKHEVATELSENQDYHGALRFLREVLEDCGHLDEVNRFHLNVKADMARVLGLVGKYNESFSFYKDIIPLMDATFGETDELTMLCKDTMGQVFLFSGNQFLKRQMSNLKWFLF